MKPKIILCLLFFLTSHFLCTQDVEWLFPETNHVNFLFCHGLGDNDKQLEDYQIADLLPPQAVSFNFNDWHDDKFDRQKAVLGQTDDIFVLNKQYDILCNQSLPIVLYGVSRGAATIINFVGEKKPTNLAALVLESPFAHVNDVVKHCAPFTVFLPINLILKYLYPNYNPAGQQPIKYIDSLGTLDVPIIFICSKTDAYVPCTTTLTLYKKLIKQRCKKVHIFMLQKGVHGYFFNEPEYTFGIHAFLKKYNLPHCEALAHKGEIFLDNVKTHRKE